MLKIVSLAVAAVALASPVLAQDVPAPETAAAGSWSFAVGAATDNRSKDASKSGNDPFVYGEAEWESADGFFYGGPSIETIKASTGSELETKTGVGIRPQIAGFDVDLNVAYKWQIDADDGQDDDSWEFTSNVSRSIGPASARLQVQYSPDSTGSTEAFTWVEAQVGWEFDDKLSASAAVGRREQDNNVDYTGWNAGVSYAVTPDLELDLRWFDTTAGDQGEQYEGALVAGVNVYF